MNFLKNHWVTVSYPQNSPKRRQSDSAISFDLPQAKKPRHPRSEGDAPETSTITKIITSPYFTARLPNQSTSMPATSGSDLTSNAVSSRGSSTTASSDAESIVSCTLSSKSTHNTATSRTHEMNSSITLQQPKTLTQPTCEAVPVGQPHSSLLDNRVDVVTTEPLPLVTSSNACSEAATTLFKEPRIQQTIIKFLVPSQKTHMPYFKQGMLRGYFAQEYVRSTQRFPGTDDIEVIKRREICEDNIQLPELLVNKSFAHYYLKLFYSRNRFQFDEARACRWFFDNIGNTNFSNLRDIKLDFYPGFDETPSFRCGLVNQCEEEQWFNLVCWLKSRHSFDRLLITFKQWPTQQELGAKMLRGFLTREEVEEEVKYQHALKSSLQGLKGIRHAQLIDSGRLVFANAERCNLEGVMRGDRPDPSVNRYDARTMPLSEVLKAVRQQFAHQSLVDENVQKQTEAAAAGTTNQPTLNEPRLTKNLSKKLKRKQQRHGNRQQNASNQQAPSPSSQAAPYGPQTSMRTRPQGPMKNSVPQKPAANGQTGGYHPGQTTNGTMRTQAMQGQYNNKRHSWNQGRNQRYYGQRRYVHNQGNWMNSVAELDENTITRWGRKN